MMEKRPALGKGLSALIPDAPEVRPATTDVDVDLLSPGDQQPRLGMDDAKLDELAASIKAHGVVQPILVRRVGSAYRIIAGERRWRAAQKAGLTKVPVVVRETGLSERELLEIAVIENVQRENLNSMDEARAFNRLASEFGLTQDQIAAALGKDRSSIANSLRLLKLPDDVQRQVAGGILSAGHARALLPLADPDVLRRAARDVVERGMSVRATESLVKKLTASPDTTRAAAGSTHVDVHTRAAEERMRFAVGTKVAIHRRATGGTIEIHFSSEEELNRIFEFITDRK